MADAPSPEPTLRPGQALFVEAYLNSTEPLVVIRGKEGTGKTFIAKRLRSSGHATRVEDGGLFGFPPSPGERIIVTMRERGPLFLPAGCVAYLMDEDTCVVDPEAVVTDTQMTE